MTTTERQTPAKHPHDDRTLPITDALVELGDLVVGGLADWQTRVLCALVPALREPRRTIKNPPVGPAPQDQGHAGRRHGWYPHRPARRTR